MKRLILSSLALLMAASLLTSCSTWDRRDTGTLAGGVIGGVAGNLVSGGSAVGTGIGAVGGAIVGNQLAK